MTDLFGEGLSGPKAKRSAVRGAAGYERRNADAYFTPWWPTQALVKLCGFLGSPVWECAAGAGGMVDPLRKSGRDVVATDLLDYGRDDIASGVDFLRQSDLPEVQGRPVQAIVTNPPYGTTAASFVVHALRLVREQRGQVAMLLNNGWDCARERRDVVGGHAPFYRKVVLQKRIIWLGYDMKPLAAKDNPREQHAWYLWDWQRVTERDGVPVPHIVYGP